MRALLRSAMTVTATAVVVSLFAAPAWAQAQEEEGPEPRYVTATIFDVPLEHRDEVFPYMEKYVLPATQLNPHVLNFRMLIHNWGSNASEVVLLSEYASFTDIGAECGTPCEEYFDAHPMPEEGDEGYEEFEKVQSMWLKYFSKHHDEIFLAPMEIAVVEGEVQGTVGPDEEEGGN